MIKTGPTLFKLSDLAAFGLFMVIAFFPGPAQAGIKDAIKSKVIDTVDNLLKDNGVQLDWKKIQYEIDPTSINQATLTLKAKNIDFHLKSLGLKTNIANLGIKLNLKVGLNGVEILEVGRLELKIPNLSMQAPDPPPPAGPFLSLPSIPAQFPIPALLARVKWGEVTIELDRIVLDLSQPESRLKVSLKNLATNRDHFKLQLNQTAAQPAAGGMELATKFRL